MKGKEDEKGGLLEGRREEGAGVEVDQVVCLLIG